VTFTASISLNKQLFVILFLGVRESLASKVGEADE